ncbi:hypothetical protein [Serratia liquefaciens]|uniref:Uncharacterized protein n=1 Tax=Serratia liquefaciens TaxID=614 RepID=A0A515CSX8_SERLI|nr:hypothetical protein [Serratia liquefaciens]QDL31282.1 hypothetical protein EGO53_05585 [Serratia liquefaciens]
MSHEITLEQATEKARQAEIILLLLEAFPHRLAEDEAELITGLMSSLVGSAAAWLLEEQSIRDKKA